MVRLQQHKADSEVIGLLGRFMAAAVRNRHMVWSSDMEKPGTKAVRNRHMVWSSDMEKPCPKADCQGCRDRVNQMEL